MSNNLHKIEAGTIIPPKINHELAQAIMKARNAKNLTQTQLANQTQIPIDKIKKYENPSSGIIIETFVLSKLSRVLNIKLTKPKAQKLEPEQDAKTNK
jgi:ribosome-binding protein aMBF1 (putative translation factor)